MRTYLKTFSESIPGKASDYFALLFPERSNTFRQYLYVSALTVAALLARLMIAPLDGGIQYVTFFPAVALSAMIGGLWPGLFSALLGAILATFLFWPPFQAFTFEFQRQTVVSNTVFLLDALVVCSSIEAMHRYYYKFVETLARQKQVEDTLRTSQEDLKRAQAMGHIGSWRLDMKRNLLTWSDENHRIFGIPQGKTLTYETVLSSTHSDDRDYVDRMWTAVLGGRPYNIEYRIVVKGKVKWVREQAEPEFTPQGIVTGVFGTTEDITKRKRAEKALQRSLASLSEAQRIGSIGDWEWKLASDTMTWSTEVYRIFGLNPQQPAIGGWAVLSRIHPDDRERVEQALRVALDERRPYNVDHRIVLPDDSIRVVNCVGEIKCDKKWRPIRIRGTVQDITERKRIEEDLEHSRTLLRKMAAHMEKVRENEKGRIAREVHDELGQLLTALRMDVSLTRIQFADGQPALRQKLESLTTLVDQTITVVRGVASNLRPSALEVGIVPAIEWLVDDFRARSGITFHFKSLDQDLELDERWEIAVFRIMQESLTNVARHANADRVDITVTKLENQFLWLEVLDNGDGFELDNLPPHKAFGLMGIRERALDLGGECLIDSTPGMGTSVSVQLPLA